MRLVSRLSKSSYWVDTFENWGFKIIQKLRQKLYNKLMAYIETGWKKLTLILKSLFYRIDQLKIYI